MASVLSQVCLIGAGEYRERKKEGKQVKEREREREHYLDVSQFNYNCPFTVGDQREWSSSKWYSAV